MSIHTPQMKASQSTMNLSQKDMQTLSALKLPHSPDHNPQKLQDFLQKRQTNYLQSSYATFYANPKQSPLFKHTESFKNMKNHHQFSIINNQREKYMSSDVKRELNIQRPNTQMSGVVAQGGGLRSVRALTRNSSMRDIATSQQAQQNQQDIQSSPNINENNLHYHNHHEHHNQSQPNNEVQQRVQTAAAQNGKQGFQNLEQSEGFQKYVKTTIDQYFGKNTGLCTCCAVSIKGQQDKVLSYKYPKCVNTLYKKDYLKKDYGKQQQFIIDNEKRNVKISFNPPQTNQSTFQADYKPYLMRSVQKDDNSHSYFSNPLFINSTTNSTTYANWGAKPFEKVREIRKMPFDSKFMGKSTYNNDFNKAEGKQLPPQFEREYDEKFYEDMKKRNQKGEFAGLLSSPFLAKSTSHEAFNNKYNLPKSKPHPPMAELVSTLNVPLVTQTEFKAQFIEKNKYGCPRNSNYFSMQTIQ